MSDEIERRLRAAGHRLPDPADADTRVARAHAVAAVRPVRRRRPLVLAFAVVLAVGGAFGVGYAVAGNGGSAKPVVIRKSAALNAGPGFLPAEGWSIGVALDPQSGSVVQATATNGNGTRIAARFEAASVHRGVPRGLLPLRLPDGGRVRTVVAHVGATVIDAGVTFRSANPPVAVVVAAREELGRLVVPACPAALPLAAADTGAAKAYVLRWLPSHYSGDASEVAGATATARSGKAMPRYGEAAADCGAPVAARSVEVDVVLPKLTQISASLSELTYFAAKTADGWTVWERAR